MASFDKPESVYIHVPFCARRCGYCDFTLVAEKDHLADQYLSAIRLELDASPDTEPLKTVYFGGGTPSHLTNDRLATLLQLVHDRFEISHDAEITLEANPLDLSDQKLAMLADSGVNRLSIGGQSFHDPTLSMLERDHTGAELLEVLHRTLDRFSNVSLDLIFGVPGQSLDNWEETLATTIQLPLTHLSTYGLTFEKGTTFWSRREKGLLQPAGEDIEYDMYGTVMDVVEAAGFEQYEISSFARPGFRSRHNQIYWTGQSFFAFGPGAASYHNGVRSTNHRSVTTWLKRILNGESGVGESEELSAEDRARELLMLGLRRNDGVNREWFSITSGFELDDLTGNRLAQFVNDGLLIDDGHAIRLTRAGRFVSDSIAVEVL